MNGDYEEDYEEDYEDIIENEITIPLDPEDRALQIENYSNVISMDREKVLDIEEDIEEMDLPAIVKNWEKVATSYSRYNNIPAIIGFYTLLGDLVKNMVEIPFGPTTNDTRIHFCWIQTARTGKTTLIMYVLNPVAKEIFEELKEDDYIDSKLVNFADYNTASLVGSHYENKKYNEDEEQVDKIYDDEIARLATLLNNEDINQIEYLKKLNEAEEKRDLAKQRWVLEKGPIHGEGIISIMVLMYMKKY